MGDGVDRLLPSDECLEVQVIEMLVGFRAEWADSGAPTYAANIIRAVREALAAEIEAEREGLRLPDGPSTAVMDGMNFAARLVRRGRP